MSEQKTNFEDGNIMRVRPSSDDPRAAPQSSTQSLAGIIQKARQFFPRMRGARREDGVTKEAALPRLRIRRYRRLSREGNNLQKAQKRIRTRNEPPVKPPPKKPKKDPIAARYHLAARILSSLFMAIFFFFFMLIWLDIP